MLDVVIRIEFSPDEEKYPAGSELRKTFDEIPWQRVPVAGDIIIGPGGYAYTVERVYLTLPCKDAEAKIDVVVVPDDVAVFSAQSCLESNLLIHLDAAIEEGFCLT